MRAGHLRDYGRHGSVAAWAFGLLVAGVMLFGVQPAFAARDDSSEDPSTGEAVAGSVVGSSAAGSATTDSAVDEQVLTDAAVSEEAQGFSFAESDRSRVLSLLGTPRMLVTADDGPQDTGTWDVDFYYISYENANASEKSDTVLNLIGNGQAASQSVKYQLEFHNSEDFEAGSVRIAVPYVLYTDRYGEDVTPSDIGVPAAPAESAVSPFHYTLEDIDGTPYIVFTNYRTIVAGSDNLIQVFYLLDDMAAIDASSGKDNAAVWELRPIITVNGTTSEFDHALTGQMDTSTTLSETTKQAYSQTGKHYYPELYTWKQVSAWSGAQGNQPDDFDSYRYVLWRTVIQGSASQPWTLVARDVPSDGGEVIWQKLYDHWDYPTGSVIAQGAGDALMYSRAQYRLSDTSSAVYLYSLVRYPIDIMPQDGSLANDVTVTLTGVDDEEVHELTSAATCRWEDYVWRYTGDDMSFQKGYGSWNHAGLRDESAWIDMYELMAGYGRDFSLPDGWQSHVFWRWYSPILAGEPSYTVVMVDDHQYVRSASTSFTEMTDDDFYYSDVSFSVSEQDIDIYEDELVAAADGSPFDIYVMVRGGTAWELAARVPFGQINGWHLPDSWIDQGVWKVKVEHESSAYQVALTMDAVTCIRKDSPVVQGLLASSQTEQLYFMDVSGVYGKYGDTTVFQDPTAIGDFGGGLASQITAQDSDDYGGPLVRDSAQVRVTRLSATNGVNKRQRIQNDPENGRVDVTYTIAGYDGYQVFDEDYVDEFKNKGVSVARDGAVIYDLLPSGVTFDPSQPVKVGRVTSRYWTMSDLESGSWATSGVTVEYSVTSNYKDSGRQLVTFTIHDAQGQNNDCTSSGLWFSGFGVEFGAYYLWDDLNIAGEAANVAAYGALPDNEGYRALKGTAYVDDGRGVPVGVGLDASGQSLYYDLDGDGLVADEPWLIYASSSSSADIALSANATIVKLAHPDEATYAEYRSDIDVEVGKGYTYSIQVNTSHNSAKDIVLYDCLEQALINHKETGDTRQFDDVSWQGTFAGVNLADALGRGIQPQVYYSADNAQPFDLRDDEGSLVDGWVLAEDWQLPLSQVKALAVDLTTTSDGTPFILGEEDAVKVLVNMTAPADLPEARYAYNVAAFDATLVATDGTESLRKDVICDSTAVSLYEPVPLEIAKSIVDDGNDHSRESFTFTLAVNGRGYSEEQYLLYNADGTQVSGIHATNKNGSFTLQGGQRAVFPSAPAGGTYRVHEAYNANWLASPDSTLSGTIGTQGTKVVFSNRYVYPLYVDKEVTEAQVYTDSDNTAFTFRLTLEGKPAAHVAYMLVDRDTSVARDPAVVSDTLYTAEDGTFTLLGSQRAMFRLYQNEEWLVEEVNVPANYQAVTGSAGGTMTGLYAHATLTNRYTLKDLYVTKSVDALTGTSFDADQEFFFTLTLDGEVVNGSYYVYEKVVTGNVTSWQLVVDDASDATGLREMKAGRFSLKADQRVRIVRLPAGASWQVTEDADTSGMFARETPADGAAFGTLPEHALSSSTAFVNQSLVRVLNISKTVVSDREVQDRFTFTLWVNDELAANTAYTLVSGQTSTALVTGADGTFTLASGETARFSNLVAGDTYRVHESPLAGFTQLMPAGNQDHAGNIPQAMQAQSVSFVNKDDQAANLVVLNKYLTGSDQAAISDLETGSYSYVPREITRTVDPRGGVTYQLNYSATRRYFSNAYGWGEWFPFHAEVRDAAGKVKVGGLSYTLIDADGVTHEFSTVSDISELGSSGSLKYGLLIPSEHDAEYRSWHESGGLADDLWDNYVSWRTYEVRISPSRYSNVDGTQALSTFGAGDFAMRATDTIVFTGLDEGDTLIITEYPRMANVGGSYYLSGDDGNWYNYLLQQVAPENNGAAEGVVGTDSVLSFTNELSDSLLDIAFYKMLNYNNVFDELDGVDATITFRIQLRDREGSITTPAGAFQYEASTRYSTEYGQSDDQGYFTWHLTADSPDDDDSSNQGYVEGALPRGYDFKIEEVSATPVELMGVLEAISCDWGVRQDEDGFWCLNDYYEDEANQNNTYLAWYLSDLSDTTTFNVKKQLGDDTEESNQDFGFTIYQSNPRTGDYEYDDAPSETSYRLDDATFHPWSNQQYRIYTSETDEFVGYGRTDARGHFTLKAGQYAQFDRPYNTIWEGYEEDEVWQERQDGSWVEVRSGKTVWKEDAEYAGIWSQLRGHLLYRVVEDTYADYSTQVLVDQYHTESTYLDSRGTTRYRITNQHTQYTINGAEAVVYTDEDLTFTNTQQETSSLVVAKTVTGAPASAADDEFTFTVRVDGELYANREYRLYDATGEVLNTQLVGGYSTTMPWTTTRFGTFILKNGQRAVFDWVGEGARYTVTEDETDGYVQVNPAQGSSLNGTITSSGAVATFTNAWESHTSTASLTIRKLLALPEGVDLSAVPVETFRFAVSVAGAPLAMTDYTVYDLDGAQVAVRNTGLEGEVLLRGGQYAVIGDIPANSDYRIEEIADGNSQFSSTGQTVREGAVETSGVTETFVNKYGSLIVQKRVVTSAGTTAPAGDIFTFVLRVDGQMQTGVTYRVLDPDGNFISSATTDDQGRFTLEAGQKALFCGIPEGSAYEVIEASKNAYTQTVPTDGASASGSIGSTAESVIFENRYNPPTGLHTSVTVQKVWDDNRNAVGVRPGEVVITLLRDGTPTGDTLTLSDENAWSGSFDNLPAQLEGQRVSYSVVEEDVEGYRTTITSGEEGTFIITNTLKPQTVAISGTKTWVDDSSDARPETITVRLLAGEQEVARVMVSESDGWSWEFSGLPKYNDNGDEIYYTISEDAVEGYTTTVEGYNIINTLRSDPVPDPSPDPDPDPVPVPDPDPDPAPDPDPEPAPDNHDKPDDTPAVPRTGDSAGLLLGAACGVLFGAAVLMIAGARSRKR